MKNILKKLSVFTLCIAIVTMSAACAMAAGYTAGTYAGAGMGRNGEIAVEVTVPQ